MGQYHLLVNVDKEEFVSPHRLGDGLKLLEQLGSQYGVPQAMHVLMCAAPCRRGGGDYEQPEHIREKVVGRWAGDRVVLIGDYAQSDDLPPDFDAGALYEKCDGETFADITPAVAEALEYLLDVLYVGDDGWRQCVRIAYGAGAFYYENPGPSGGWIGGFTSRAFLRRHASSYYWPYFHGKPEDGPSMLTPELPEGAATYDVLSAADAMGG